MIHIHASISFLSSIFLCYGMEILISTKNFFVCAHHTPSSSSSSSTDFCSDFFITESSFKGSKDAGLNQRRTRYKKQSFHTCGWGVNSRIFFSFVFNFTHIFYLCFLVTGGSYNYFLWLFCIFSSLFYFIIIRAAFSCSILCRACLLYIILLSIYFSCECEIVKKLKMT